MYGNFSYSGTHWMLYSMGFFWSKQVSIPTNVWQTHLTLPPGLYYLAFPYDRAILKAVVYMVVAIGTLQTGLALHDFHALFCTNDYLSKLSDPHNFGFMWLTIPTSIATGKHRLFILQTRKFKCLLPGPQSPSSSK